ncbi:MAG: FAD-binding oxidoreductase [Proteobacteria bacterium]|nr:FAD-binding oxidoreductase [Pseudomonadota bacterium]
MNSASQAGPGGRAITRSLPTHADVVIVGGGFAGAATAYQLTRMGIADVVVVEREAACGYHASGRNAALGRQLTEDDGFTAFTVRGCEFLRNPPAGFSDQPLVRQTGSLLLVDHRRDIDAMAARARRWNLPHERVTAAQLAQRWPYLHSVPTAGGVHFLTDGVIDVHAHLFGFLHGARKRGARIETNCEVIGLSPRGGAVAVETGRGVIQARCAVLAAGAWVGQVGRLAGAEPVQFAPIRRHLFVTETVPDLDRDAPFVWHVGAHEFYVRPEGNGYLLSGCDETEVAPSDVVPAQDAVEVLAAKLSPIVPALAGFGIARTWACLRTFTPDRRPLIGWDERLPWLFWVAALGGHGATGSAAVGETAARAIAARIAPR